MSEKPELTVSELIARLQTLDPTYKIEFMLGHAELCLFSNFDIGDFGKVVTFHLEEER